MPRKPAQPVDKTARFAKLMDRYKTYDTSNGFGSVGEWQQAWEQKMGTDQAQAVLGADDPLSVLGLGSLPSAMELKRVYYKLCMQNQDCFRADATEEQQARAKHIIAAYSLLEDRVK